MSVIITISRHTKTPSGLIPAMRVHLLSAMRLLHISEAQWSIALVDDAAMIELHKRTMDIASTTDVLTFDLREVEKLKIKNQKSKMAVDLDTVICIDEATRRAADLSHPLLHEVLLYAIHSLLHVAGFDDKTESGARKMHKKEDEILTQLRIGPVYTSLRVQS